MSRYDTKCDVCGAPGARHQIFEGFNLCDRCACGASDLFREDDTADIAQGIMGDGVMDDPEVAAQLVYTDETDFGALALALREIEREETEDAALDEMEDWRRITFPGSVRGEA